MPSGKALPRRGLLLGAGAAAGAAALVARGLPGVPAAAPEAAAAAVTKAEGGYQETPHVLRYYETARS